MSTARLSSVLIIDDDEPTNYLNNMVMEEIDCADTVVMMESAREALDHLARVPDPPDLILLDVNMPRMDGWEFLEAYRTQTPAGGKQPVIIILTTSYFPDDQQRADAHPQVTGLRQKPLTLELMEDILAEYFGA